MRAILKSLVLLLPITLYAAPINKKFDVAGISLGTHKKDFQNAIPKAKCTIKSNTIEVCEISTKKIADTTLAKTEGLVTFLLDKDIVEVIIVKVPYSFHGQVKTTLQARLG